MLIGSTNNIFIKILFVSYKIEQNIYYKSDNEILDFYTKYLKNTMIFAYKIIFVLYSCK